MNTDLRRPEAAIIAERRIDEYHDRPRRWLQPGPCEDDGELIPVLAEMHARFAVAVKVLDKLDRIGYTESVTSP